MQLKVLLMPSYITGLEMNQCQSLDKSKTDPHYIQSHISDPVEISH